MARSRSIDSRIKEARKYREQCRRRIKPGIQVSAICTALVIAWSLFLPTNLWIAAALLAFVWGNTGLEVVGYHRNDRKLSALMTEKAAEPGATDNPGDAQRLREDH